MQPMRKRQGMAIVVALITITVLMTIGGIMFSRTVNDMKSGQDNSGIAQALMLARGGASAGGGLLVNQIKDQVDGIVSGNSVTYGGAYTGAYWAYGGSGTTPDMSLVVQRLALVATQAQVKADNYTCNVNFVPDGVTATVTVRIFFTSTACASTTTPASLPSGVNIPSGRMVLDPTTNTLTRSKQVYTLPFVMVVEGSVGNNYKRNIVIQGEYQLVMNNTTFAYYALLTNRHKSAAGSAVWFNDNTLFDGPVHTNENFRFQFKPWFGGQVTSAGCKDASQGATYCTTGTNRQYGAYFNGSTTFTADTSMQPNATAPVVGSTAPTFAGSPAVNWRYDYIPMPTNNLDQKAKAQGTSTSEERGIYVNGDVTSLSLFASGTSDCSAALTKSGSDWTPSPAPYQCVTVQYGTTTDQYRIASNRKLYKLVSGSWVQQTNTSGEDLKFNGMIYADGAINALKGPTRTTLTDSTTAPPALAEFSEITVGNAGTGKNIRVTGDLTYEEPACTGALSRSGTTVTRANCNQLTVDNVLGIYSQNGNILLGTGDNNSLTDLTIHGVMMTANGEVTVDQYSVINPKGSIKLQGGIIENTYGAFGTFNNSTGQMSTGYGRQFTYDPRMATISPPYFPTTEKYHVTAATPYIFGQREQIY